MKLFYLGPDGSYSSIAARRIEEKVKGTFLLEEVSTIRMIFEKIIANNSLGLVPLENSTSGDVYDTYAMMMQEKIQIVTEVVLPIKHALIVLKGAKFTDITQIYSHPQALLQISEFTNTYQLQTIATQSTMDACNVIINKNQKNCAAVAQNDAIKHLDTLEVLPMEIGNHKSNFTRFLVIKSGEQTSFNSNTIFIAFSLREDAPGGLTAILAIIADAGINLKSIKSRPIEGAKFKYYFVVEGFARHMLDEDHKQLKSQLSLITESLTYSVYETEE